MFIKTRKTVKKYRQGNIPAAFGSDLWLSGATNVPNLLLRLYRYMHITDSEMMTLIQMFRLRAEEKELHPSPEVLSESMFATPEEIQSYIRSLMEKKIITETLYYEESRDDVVTGYDFEPLFEKLSDYWAFVRAKEIEKAGSKLDGNVRQGSEKELAACFSSFEKEFGRPLSPIEAEKITQWVEQMNPELVLEGLRRAVLIGKRNFRYIDTILLEWKKNNLFSLASIEEYDRQFQVKRPVRDIRKRGKNSGVEGGAGGDIDKRKDLIKKLYMT